MSKKIKVLIIALSSVVCLLGLSYIGLAYYYSYMALNVDQIDSAGNSSGKSFTYGTYVNNIYATGLTIEQLEDELAKQYSGVDTAVFTVGEDDYSIVLGDIDYKYDYHDVLVNCLNSQNPLLWGANLISAQFINIEPNIVLDENKYSEIFEAFDLGKKINNSGELYIYFDENDGYVLYDGKTNAFNISKVKEFVLDKLKAGETRILIDEECKNEVRYSDHDEYLLKYYDILSEHQKRDLNYRFGKENLSLKGAGWDRLYCTEDIIEKITPAMVKSDICVDGIDFNVDKERVLAFLTEYLDEYNTYNNRYFITHDGTEVYVKDGNYGNRIDLEAEADWLLNYINNNDTVLYRNPEYKIKANYQEKNDFGDTFIEIDLDCQRMWYYVDGKTYVDTNVVTGSFYRDTSCTSPRVVSVYTIIPNKWLNGPTWHCFVKYWVAIQGAIGIHDASWRTDWTDDAYRTGAGSHGCINTPESEMKKIFEHVQIGTPVIVYSHKVNGTENKE